MRVTSLIISSNLTSYLSRSLESIGKLQNQISSGKKLNKPSDDASRVSAALEINSRIERNNQYLRNIDDGFAHLGLTENTLNDVSNLILRAKDLGIQASSDGLNNQDRTNIAIEIDSLIEHLLSLSNKESVDGYVFGGTKTDSVPFVAERDSQSKFTRVLADGNISGKIYRSVGDNDPVEISSDYAGILYGSENVFETLIQLRDSLQNNNLELIRDSMGKLKDKHFEAIVTKITEIGVKGNFFLDRKSEIENDFIQFTIQLSEIEDTDIAESIVLLEQHLVAYQAALLAGNRILETTLRNILR